MSSANGACGRLLRHDSVGMRPVSADQGVAIKGPQVDRLRGPAGRAAHPLEPMPRLERAADCRREQHRHALGLPLVPCRHEPASVFEDLRFRRKSSGRFLLGGFGASCFHLAAVESHGPIVIGFVVPSTCSGRRKKNLRVVRERVLSGIDRINFARPFTHA